MKTRNSRSMVACLLVVFGVSTAAVAQVATGTPPFGSFGGGPDIINLANLNAHINVPVIQKAGRGMPFTYDLSYDTSVWYPTLVNGVMTWQPVNNWGWRGQTEVATGYVSYSMALVLCGVDKDIEIWEWEYGNFVYHDPWGTPHYFKAAVSSCRGVQSASATATDGSGYQLYATAPGPGATITDSKGTVSYPPLQSGSGSGNSTDSNGNQITVNNSGQFFDTLSSTTPVLTVSGTAPNPVTFTYTPPSGTNVSYTMNYTTYTVQTNFGCTGSSAVAEYSATQVPLVSSISLPDGTSYSFTYELTPGYPGDVTGRLASATLPTGGTISYTYSGGSNGITCADGSAAGLTRQTPDGTWTYARTLGSGAATTTTITDPTSQANQTVINFQGIYQTERQVYQGSSSSGTLLETLNTCYNGNTSNCNSTAITLPITQRTVIKQWGQSGLQKETNTLYDGYGNVTEKNEYDYASGAPGALLRETLISYTAFSNFEKPYQITVEDGSGNIKAQTTYTYDQFAVTATSGTPQQVSVGSSRGNPTTVAQLVAGGTTLSRTFTYYDTGNIYTATDVNGAQTTYTYNSTGCANSLPTQVSLPLSLSRSMAWNCTGGVMTSLTDENGNTSSTAYTDAYFWRPASSTDQANYVTNITYTGETQVESVLSFNGGNSAADALTGLDSLGRTHVSQRRQAPGSSSFDTVETDYDSVGRRSRRTVPYTGSAGQTNSSAPAITTSYDALSRRTQVTDGGGGFVTRSYNQNDTLRTLGPAPQNENTKQSQRERDGLGRLTSVCEVTSASGSGSCAQTSPQTGYWTKYTYDVLNDLTSVAQNAQGTAQNRTYAYDGLGRLTSETNPENGTTTYTYDTDATCGTSTGDLVKRVDAVGNTTCYAYDSLHRKTKVTYSGSYSTATPTKCFVYDSATLNSTSMANAKNRLAEAYTTTSATCTGTGKVTDTYFSYSVRGELTDVYESTPHSGGYYHSTALYWANGALNTLNPLNNNSLLPTITYGVDGEGRPNSAGASSGLNPVLSTSYDVASHVTGLTLGTYDSDAFTFDPNTGRMTQYNFTVGSTPQSVIGNLTWNANGTLQQLAITDQFNSANTQTCTYVYDDLKRIAGNQTNAGVNCTNGSNTVWSQTFGYDVFGNISKSGSVSFQPTYSASTNRMSSLPGFTPTYDANGNTTADSLHSYAWDAEGRPVTIDSVGLTYDALGRMAEQASGSSYTQILYGPTGKKLALMNAQSVTKAFIPLPAGAAAVYTAGPTLSYFRHPDWLGSSRVASTPARTMYYDGAYAPFGETYAEVGTADRSFTGQNQDTIQGSTTGLYDFMFREYAQYGRWISPDPAGRAAVRRTNPQTWNRYAYVVNNPLRYRDPLGRLLCECDDGDDDGGDDGGDGGDDGSLDAGYTMQVTVWASADDDDDDPDDPFNDPDDSDDPSDDAANNGPQQPQNPAQQQPQHFWQKPGCGEALGELGIGLAGTAITAGAVVASIYLGPELFEGVEGLMTILHLAPAGAPGLILTVQGGVGVWNNCR